MKQKMLSLGLVLVLLLQCSQPVFATTLPIQNDASAALVEPYPEDASRREEQIKHFKNPDGEYVAAIYSDPVHYQEDGQWKDIDNTLSLVTPTEKGTALAGTTSAGRYYENKSNAFKVKLPQLLTKDQALQVSYEQYSLSFRMLGIADSAVSQVLETEDPESSKADLLKQAKAAASKKDVETQKQLVKQASTMLSNQNSGLLYSNVQENVNLEYYIVGQKLKENIVLNAPPSQSSFSFELTYAGLTPVVQQFGAVYFFDSENLSEQPVFVIHAPYMEDSSAEDTLCMDIDVSVTPTATGCIYTITPDKEWLQDPTRVYPVVIDPIVEFTSRNTSDIEDAGVNQYNPTTNYQTVDRMYVGSNLSGSTAYESRIYIRFPRIAAIATNAYISEATMYLDHHSTTAWQTASNLKLHVYEVGSYNWSSSNITWNSQSGYSFSNLIDEKTSQSSDARILFDITSLVRKWYATTNSNNGLVVKPKTKDTTKTNRTCYYSSDHTTEGTRPRILIAYYPAKTLLVPQYGQEHSMWCWAACVQMMANYYGYTVTQKNVVVTTKGLNPNTNEALLNLPASVPETVVAMNNATNSSAFEEDTFISEVTLFSRINLEHPVIIGRVKHDNSTGHDNGHMMVVYGFTCINGVRYYLIRDPWPINSNPWPTNNPGQSYMMTFAQIANETQGNYNTQLTAMIYR